MNQQRIHDGTAVASSGMNRRVVLKGIGAGATAALLASTGATLRLSAAQQATQDAASGSYLVMRLYQLAPGVAIEEVVRRTEEGFVPIIEQIPGFLEYYNVDLGEGQGVTMSIFTSREGAEESTEQATVWAMENLAELTAGPPELLQGPILLHVDAEASASTAAT